MFRVKISLAQFYGYCLEAAQQSGYYVAVCLIAREADSPNIYEELSKYWSSLHDLTGKEVLFLFAGDSIDNKIANGVTHPKEPIFFYSDSMAISNPNHFHISIPVSEEDINQYGSTSPHLDKDSSLCSEQTLQISELRRMLSVQENDVPVLHFTFLISQETYSVPIGSLTDFSVYQFLKDLIADWDRNFSSVVQLQRESKHLRAELQEKTKYSFAFESELQYIRRASVSEKDTDLKEIYNRLVEILSNSTTPAEREEYYSLLNKAKSKLPDFHSYIFRSLQRAFDLYQQTHYKQYDISGIRAEIEGTEKSIREQHLFLKKVLKQRSNNLPVNLFQSKGVAKLTSILFLAADPTNASRLRLGEEFREIQEKLKFAQLRDHFKLKLPQLSVRPVDISQALLDTHPQIVHFSGHGTSNGALCFENQSGQTHLVAPDALAALFEQFTNQVNCVLLNACYSKIQAKAIAEHIEYVIGMNQAIGDKAAIAFAIGFYQALGAGRTTEDAYKLGCVQIRLQGIPEHVTPVLIKKGQVQQ